MSVRKRLQRLEDRQPPSREQYRQAFVRARLRVIRELGAELTTEEDEALGGQSVEADAATLSRYRDSLPEKRAERQRHAILQAAYREAERRGADPLQEDVFSELETVLKSRGYDAGDVRGFME